MTIEIPAGGRYSDIERTIASASQPVQPTRLREKSIALRQEMALLAGREPDPPEVVALEVDAESQRIRAELAADLNHRMATGPGTSGRWEANPFGLSGRAIRGYRHWRHKR